MELVVLTGAHKESLMELYQTLSEDEDMDCGVIVGYIGDQVSVIPFGGVTWAEAHLLAGKLARIAEDEE